MPGPTVQFSGVGAAATLNDATGLPSQALGTAPVGPAVAAGLGASPATFTNTSRFVQALYINAGASQTTTITKQGVIVATAVVPAATGIPLVVLLGPGQTCVVTFSAALTSQFVDTL